MKALFIKYWILLTLIAALAGAAAAASVNALFVHGFSVSAGVLMGSADDAHNGFAEGKAAGEKHAAESKAAEAKK